MSLQKCLNSISQFFYTNLFLSLHFDIDIRKIYVLFCYYKILVPNLVEHITERTAAVTDITSH